MASNIKRVLSARLKLIRAPLAQLSFGLKRWKQPANGLSDILASTAQLLFETYSLTDGPRTNPRTFQLLRCYMIATARSHYLGS